MDKKDQKKIVKEWKVFSKSAAYQDLIEYIDMQREMYRKYGEELQMPSPSGEGMVPIPIETAGILLQNSRGLNIVRTYIESRVNMADVAQSTSKK